MLDLMQIPYTHAGLETSVIAIDKELTKMVLVPHGIRMPKGKIVESSTLYEGDPMARPYVLKPVNEGSRSASRSSPTRAITANRSAPGRKGRGCTSSGCWPSPSSAGAS